MTNSFLFELDEKEEAGSRFISLVNSELQRAFFSEKAQQKFTQQAIATKLGVHRSFVNRIVMGLENVTVRTIGEFLWAIGWEPFFEARKFQQTSGQNEFIPEKKEAPISNTNSETSTSEPMILRAA